MTKSALGDAVSSRVAWASWVSGTQGGGAAQAVASVKATAAHTAAQSRRPQRREMGSRCTTASWIFSRTCPVYYIQGPKALNSNQIRPLLFTSRSRITSSTQPPGKPAPTPPTQRNTP